MYDELQGKIISDMQYIFVATPKSIINADDWWKMIENVSVTYFNSAGQNACVRTRLAVLHFLWLMPAFVALLEMQAVSLSPVLALSFNCLFSFSRKWRLQVSYPVRSEGN